MTNDLLVVSVIATIVEDPETIPMSVRLPTKEETILQNEGVEEKNHHQEKEGVEMIVMNKEHPEKQGFGKEGQVIKELHKTNTPSSCW